MSSIIVNGATPFGGMSNGMVDSLNGVNEAITRLAAAAADAASGYTGTAGTEYETGTNFGVVPSATPGAQGSAYAFALNNLASNWAAFWSANAAYISALDNG